LVDVLIAGGGPAGLAAGICAARAGLEVVIAEPRSLPIDKACGEGLMPGALRALSALGVNIQDGYRFTGVCYRQGSVHVSASFPNGHGLGVRRVALQTQLYQAAKEAGVRWVEERVEAVKMNTNSVSANGHTARWLLVADGLNSRVAQTLGLHSKAPDKPRFGVRQHFATAPWSDRVEVYWSKNAEAYVTPVSNDTVGVALLFRKRGRFDTLIADFPSLKERLGQPCSTQLGAGPFWRIPPQRTKGRALLIGDAAGFLDPLTGEGLRLGIISARLAIDAILANAPERYERAWPAMIRPYRWLTAGLLSLANNPWTRAGIVPVAAKCPWVFRRLVRMLSK
jgi:flavin-dependent dehydrogenase